jgi:hypothetical protein
MTLQAYFNGKSYTQPSSATKIDSSALNPIQLGYSGIAAVVGTCTKGKPLEPMIFAATGNLKTDLGGGKAYDAARACFSPTSMLVEGSSVRPQFVYVVRTDDATQSSYTAKESSGTLDSMTFTSSDYGAHTNSITLNINTTSAVFDTPTAACLPPDGISPLNLSLVDVYNNFTESYTNVGASSLKFSIQYTAGDSPCVVTVSNTGIVATCSSKPENDLNIPFATYETISQIVGYIEGLGLPYTVANESPDASVFNGMNLDYFVSGDAVAAALGFYAVTQAIVDAVNPVSGICQITLATSNRPPVPVSPATSTTANLRGGSTDSTYDQDRIMAALDALSTVRINFLCGTYDADPGISGHDAGAIFGAFVDNMQGQNECRCHLGLSQNITYPAAKAYAAKLNTSMVNLWFQGPIMPNDQGVTTTYDPWMQASLACGMQAGMPVGSSFVMKSFNVYGYSYNTSSANGFDIVNDADAIIQSRLSLVRFDKSTSTWNCVRALSSYVSDGNSFHIEPGIESAVNYAVYEIRKDIETKFLGQRTLFTEAGSAADSIQRELVAFSAALEAEGVIQKATITVNNQKRTLPALVIDSVTITDDTVRLRYGIRPVGTINFIFHTVSLNATSQVA